MASNPTEEGFRVVWELLRDQALVEQFTNKLATHLINFNEEENPDGLRSAWSDSTCSEASEYEDDFDDVSPSDVAMDVIRSIDDAIEEVSLAYTQWSTFPVGGEPQERDITESHGTTWL